MECNPGENILVSDMVAEINLKADKTVVSTKLPKDGSEPMTGNLEAPSMSIGGNYLSPYSNRNILINGWISNPQVINQRGASDITDTTKDGAHNLYSFDRWIYTGGTVRQRVEEGNYMPNVTHTLSGTNIVTRQITSPASGTWEVDTLVNNPDFVQLEEGSVATPFEQLPIGQTLSLCQRYYQKSLAAEQNFQTTLLGTSSRIIVGSIALRVTMRITPVWQITDTADTVGKISVYSDTSATVTPGIGYFLMASDANGVNMQTDDPTAVHGWYYSWTADAEL